jgi:hypothetical protein
MASIYKINIKTVSPFSSYDTEYVKNMFEEFLKKYRDEKTGLKFESTEIEVEKQ